MRIVPLLLVAALWQVASMAGLLPKAVLPAFSDVIVALAGLVTSGEIFPDTAASFLRAGTGFAIAVVLGVTLGLLMARVRAVQRAVEPILLVIYPVPKPALIPLFMVWLGIGDISKITVIALSCLLPVVVSTFNGALWRVVLPAALPQIATGVRTAIAIAIIVLVSSEFISAERGLGFLIFSYGGVGADDAMLAVILYLTALGYLLDRAYVAGLRRLMAWHEFAH
jgi:ABC-type nitrate/sulfonate/bicarbonate transport system permease component